MTDDEDEMTENEPGTQPPPRKKWTPGKIVGGAAAVFVALAVLGAIGGGTDQPVTPDPVDRSTTAAPIPGPTDLTTTGVAGPTRTAAPVIGMVINQNGLRDVPELQLDRAVYDVSTEDLETAFEGADFFPAGQTDDCGLASNEDLGVAGVTRADLSVTAFVVERPDAVTEEGIRIGSTTDDIVATYGKGSVFAREVPSRSGGQLLWVSDLESPGQDPTKSSLHYGFDTDASGTFTRIRAGFWPHVADVDYCSDEAGRSEQTGWPLG